MKTAKTTLPKMDQLVRKWYILDAEDLVLGRMATEIATVLMGKHRPLYTPYFDTGDHIVVINADKIALTGKKKDQKVYIHHTWWIGGLVETPYKKQLEKNPDHILYLAVRRMLPKTLLGKKMMSKLKIYSGSEHPHHSQQPEPFPLPLKKYQA